MCVTCVMIDRGAGPRDGGRQQGHNSDWLRDQSRLRAGRSRSALMRGGGIRTSDSVWKHLFGAETRVH